MDKILFTIQYGGSSGSETKKLKFELIHIMETNLHVSASIEC